MPKGVYKRTKPTWNKGKKLSKEHREKMSKAHIGKEVSNEARKNMSEAHKGLKHSKETKQKLSIVNTGRKHTKESKKKMSILAMGNKNSPTGDDNPSKRPEVRKKISEAKKGTICLEETKKKISKAKKGKPNLSVTGNKHPNWKGGITPENKKIRKSIEYCSWREAVFSRDDYICQKCRKKGGMLHPHHIQNFSQYLELRFITDNGITFCKDCHLLFHKIYGMQDNNKEQIIEFIEDCYSTNFAFLPTLDIQ